jgi:uncharacterized repeat protein (TIGR01451 family)
MSVLFKAAAAAALVVPVAAIAAPVELNTHIMVEAKKPAADGTVKVVLVQPGRVVPGDRVVFQVAYRNTGKQAASDVVITNPVPAQMAYAGVAGGSPAPEVSIDGVRFGTLAQFSVRGADGRVRAATGADVRVVRWRLNPIAAGGSGQVAFRAILK